MATKQQKWFAYQANRNKLRSGGASESFSAEAQAVIDKLTNPTELEQTSIATYIDAEVANGNQALKDYEILPSLGSTNGVIDFVGTKTAIPTNGPTFSINGIILVRASNHYLRTAFVPSVDGVNYTQNDCIALAFVFAAPNVTDQQGFFFTIGTGVQSGLNYQPGSSRTQFGITEATASKNDLTMGSVDKDLIGIRRTGATALDSLQNGATSAASTDVSTGLSNVEYDIGRKSTSGNQLDGTISYFMLGGQSGFDIAAHNTNLRAMLTSLGLSL